MPGSDYLARDAVEIARAVNAHDCSAEALLQVQFDEIDRLEPHAQVYISQTRERALTNARAVDTAVDSKPLAGVPMALKDIYDMTGVATTAAMSIHRDNIAAQDATVVSRLESAGALLLGKVTLTEGVYAEHRDSFPVPKNPWHDDYWPGASSSGSGVAVAAGLCCAALGSETGGSIKLPAAANGVTALKPTWGRVSRYGVFELAATLDHVGPFARSVTDVAAIMNVIAGPDDNDPTAAQIAVPDYPQVLTDGAQDLRIGIDPDWVSGATDAATFNALNDAIDVLRDAGAEIKRSEVPNVNEMIWDWFPVCAAQTALAHAQTFPSQREHYGPALTQLLEMGNDLSATEYQKVLLRREAFRGRLNAMFESVDLLALPVLAFPVPTLERMSDIDDDLIAGLHRFTCPFNLSGHPGLVLPCGVNEEGLPIVFQLIGKHFDEQTCLAAGAEYQERTNWHRQGPRYR